MSKAVCFIRQSYNARGDSASLEIQRDVVPSVAEDFADEVDVVDLGRHTGFSIHVKDKEQERIDDNEEVLDALERIREGEYEYIIAYDDSRIARDEFFWEFKRAAEYGDAQFEFVDDAIPNVDSLEFAVNRTVEQKMKEREMAKAKQSRQQRMENGFDMGRPKFGTEYDESGEYLIPNEDFSEVVTALRMRADGATYGDIEDDTEEINKTLLSKMFNDRLEFYLELAEEHGYEVPDKNEFS